MDKQKQPYFVKGFGDVHWGVVACVIGLAIFGIVMIYSASSYNAEKNFGSSMYFVNKQIVGLVLGLCVFAFCYFFNYSLLQKLMYPALALGLIVLVLVLIPGVGIELYGARRWIGIGGFSFQASEIAKFCFIIFASGYMSKYKERMQTFWGSMPVLLCGGVFCCLIMLEPNMSITICMGVLMLTMLLIGGMRIKHFGLMSIPMIAAVPVLILIEPYRMQRLMAFLDPWANPQGEGFQLIQSLYALGNGGWFGVGLFNSRQKYSFLPFSESDFIFSIVGEELGFFGCLILLGVFIALIVFGYKIAMRAKDRLGCYLAVGVSTIIAVQVLLNVAVVTGAVPPTGLPLPFISAGGTSLIMFMAGAGVLLNIHKQSKLATRLVNDNSNANWLILPNTTVKSQKTSLPKS